MELETHYSLRCLLNAQSGLRSTAAELAKLRRRLDKMLREKGMETARPVHDSIVRGKEKLCSLLNGSRLSLLEIGQEELASASQKLVSSNYGAGLYADADLCFKVCRPASNQR